METAAVCPPLTNRKAVALTIMAGAMDWVLAMQQELAAEKKNNDEKKRAHPRQVGQAMDVQMKQHLMRLRQATPRA